MARFAFQVSVLVTLFGCAQKPAEQAKPLVDAHLFQRPQNDHPPIALIRRIEQRLTRNKCIGDLGQWTRRYGYVGRLSNDIDRSSIYVFLDEVGRFSWAGVRIEGWEPPNPDGSRTIDLRHDPSAAHYRHARGIYRSTDDKIHAWHCDAASTEE